MGSDSKTTQFSSLKLLVLVPTTQAQKEQLQKKCPVYHTRLNAL